MKEILHSKTEDGKGPADVHFATAMKHVDTYIERNKYNVVTPFELVCAINYGDGMMGCIGEMIYVNKKSESCINWEAAFRGGGDLGDLGRINQFKYRENGENVNEFIVEARTYMRSKPVI